MSIPKPEPGPRGRRSFALAGLLLLFALPLALRLRPIAHGAPRNYVPDTHVVPQALGMARDRDPFPPVGRYSTYPNLVPYLLVPAYAALYAGGRVAGAWSDVAAFGEAVSERPFPVQLVARLLVALLGAITPWVVFRTARQAGLREGAWVAAWLVATGLLHLHFSVQERPWVPMVFFLSLSAWAAMRAVEAPSARRLALSGALAGLAFACHQSGLPALGLPGLAWAITSLRRGSRLRVADLGQGVAAVAAFGLAALLLGYPQRLLHGSTPVEATIGGEAGDLSIFGQSHVFGWRLESIVHLSRAGFGYDPVLVLLGLFGLPLAWRVRAARPPVAFALLWAAYFLPHENDHVRYLLPLAVLLALPAGFTGQWLFRRGAAGRVALLILLALPLVQCLRFGHLMAGADSRALAEERVPPLLPPGALLAVDRYGPAFDLDREALELLSDLRGRRGASLSTRERARLERSEREPIGGLRALGVQELFDFDEAAGTVSLRTAPRDGLPPPGGDPPERLRSALLAEGATHLLLVERTPGRLGSALLRPLVEGGLPLLVIDPSRGPGPAEETRLPTEMDFPLTALWRVERPGPRMELHRIAP